MSHVTRAIYLNFEVELKQHYFKLLQTTRNIVAITGAGLSAASGIPTFRTGGGLWETQRRQARDASGISGRSRSSLVIQSRTPAGVCDALSHLIDLTSQSIIGRLNRILAASPNAAHYALAVLSLPSYLSTVAHMRDGRASFGSTRSRTTSARSTRSSKRPIYASSSTPRLPHGLPLSLSLSLSLYLG
ncbi:hypothetical protein B0H10DRAFT_2217309 [Mycena sp. CBHHK59/15]|nr:hypothetical protein B0H10DRAFT_2217309 [Mycena sp. CBHHK59/15]